MGDAGDAYEMNEDIVDSQEPLTKIKGFDKGEPEEEIKNKDTKKDLRSFFLSIFNLMNAILGSGILGLAEAMMNLGVVVFYTLLIMTACLAGYTINLLLTVSGITKEKSYEGLAFRAFGVAGKVAVSIMIIFHCLGAMCSYVYIIKTEMPEVVKVFAGYEATSAEETPFYVKGEFLMILVVLLVIVPLASMRDIRFLGYSSAFGMACMLLFTFTVVAKKFSIPCPLPQPDFNFTEVNVTEPSINNHSLEEHHHGEPNTEEQVCEPKLAKMNRKSAYAVPTMFFAFMCHASMLPIYQELRRPSIRKMQKVANISIFNVLFLYMLSASFGYFTFYNYVKSELLLTYSEFDPSDPLIVLSRIMVLVCVTLSVPLLHYPCRKTIITTMLPNPQQFSWVRHLLVMAGAITVTVILVAFIPNIRDIFGIAGATSSTSLLVLFPCAFYIWLTNDRTGGKYKRKAVAALGLFGLAFMILSVSLIILDWTS